MPRFLREGYVNLLTSGSQLMLLFIAIRANDRPTWAAMLLLIASLSFFAWASNLRRGRAIADTPTSRIASAAQGYAEIYGRVHNAEQHLAQARGGSLPCVWFRCDTYRRNSQNKWEHIRSEVSDSTFELHDGSGNCMVDPDDAEVITTHRRTWYEGDYKHEEEQLLPSDRIYVLGEFVTVGGAQSALDPNEDVRMLLAEWKRDHPALLKRFDLDGNGQIDLQEWELARKAARREVEKQHLELRQTAGVNIMRRPAAGQLFLLSNLSPQQLRCKYLFWGVLHLAMFFGGLAGAFWFGVLMTPGGVAGV